MEDGTPGFFESITAEQISFIRRSAVPIGVEKNRLSPLSHSATFDQIISQLRLGQQLPDSKKLFREYGLPDEPRCTDRRKADLLTTVAAAKIMKNATSSQAVEAAALLLVTSFQPQAEIQFEVAALRKSEEGAGEALDMKTVKQIIGDRIAYGVQTGKIDRIMACCVATYAEEYGISKNEAVKIAQAMVKPHLIADSRTMTIIRDLKSLYGITSNIVGNTGVIRDKPQNVSIYKLSRIALSSLIQAGELRDQKKVGEILARLVESGEIPDKINSLQGILDIINQNPEIQGVSLDLYDTLVQWTESWDERQERMPARMEAITKKMGIPITREQLATISSAVGNEMHHLFQSRGIEVPIEGAVGEMVRRIAGSHRLIPAQQSELQQRIVKMWYRTELENAVVMPEAKNVLATLKARGIKVGLTSNAQWSREHVERVLQRFGLLGYFDAVSISSEPKRMKIKKAHNHSSHHEFFHHSWDKLGLPYASILHVGDNPEADVEGARDANGKAVQYDNPLAYNRIEKNKLWKEDPVTYAGTVVELQKQALELEFDEWIKSKFEGWSINGIDRSIPKAEQQRLFKLSKQLYVNSRDIFAPMYMNMGEHILQKLNKGEADVAACLARDGLPLSIVMKQLRFLDPERYSNVKPDQIKFIFASRDLLDKVSAPQSREEQELRGKYLSYLGQRGISGKGRVLIVDNVSGTGKNFAKMRELLSGSDVEGFFLDVMYSPDGAKRSFFKEALNNNDFIFPLYTVFPMESLFNGPNNSVGNMESRDGLILPKPVRKTLSPHVLTRGLSENSIMFLNYVATQGIMDGTSVRNRARQVGIPDPSDNQVTLRFFDYQQNGPVDDLRLSVPWQDKDPVTGADSWYLPDQNEFEDPRIPKPNPMLKMAT